MFWNNALTQDLNLSISPTGFPSQRITMTTASRSSIQSNFRLFLSSDQKAATIALFAISASSRAAIPPAATLITANTDVCGALSRVSYLVQGIIIVYKFHGNHRPRPLRYACRYKSSQHTSLRRSLDGRRRSHLLRLRVPFGNTARKVRCGVE